MAVNIFTCPQCQATMRSAKALAAGTKIRCPKCAAVFVLPERGNGDAPREAEPVKKKAAVPPPRRPAAEVAMYDDEDDAIERDEEEVRPRKKKLKGKKKKKKGLKFDVGRIVAIALAVLFIGAVGGALYWFLRPLGTEPLAFVLPNSTLVMGMDVETLIDQSGFASQIEQSMKQAPSLPGRFNPANCKRETDLEFKELFNQITYATTEPLKGTGLNQNSKGVTVVVSKKSFDREKVLKFLGVEESDIVWSKKTFYKPKRGGQVGFIVPSDRVIIFSNLEEKDLGPVQSSGGRKPALSPDVMGVVDSVRQGQHAWFFAPFDDKARQEFQNQLKSAGSAGQDMKELQAALPNAKGVGGWLKIEGGQLKLSGGVACADEAVAGKVKDDFQKTWNKYTKGVTGTLLISAALAQVPEPVRPVVQDVMKSVNFTTQGTMALASLRVSIQVFKDLAPELERMGAGGFTPPGGFNPGGNTPPNPGGTPGGRRPGRGRGPGG